MREVLAADGARLFEDRPTIVVTRSITQKAKILVRHALSVICDQSMPQDIFCIDYQGVCLFIVSLFCEPVHLRRWVLTRTYRTATFSRPSAWIHFYQVFGVHRSLCESGTRLNTSPLMFMLQASAAQWRLHSTILAGWRAC